jgi:hypothetical protein
VKTNERMRLALALLCNRRLLRAHNILLELASASAFHPHNEWDNAPPGVREPLRAFHRPDGAFCPSDGQVKHVIPRRPPAEAHLSRSSQCGCSKENTRERKAVTVKNGRAPGTERCRGHSALLARRG